MFTVHCALRQKSYVTTFLCRRCEKNIFLAASISSALVLSSKKILYIFWSHKREKKISAAIVFKMKSRIPQRLDFFLPFEDDLWCHCWKTNVYNIILVLYCYPQFDRILTIPMYSNGLDYLFNENDYNNYKIIF